MGRLILLVIAVLALVWLLRRALRNRAGHDAQDRASGTGADVGVPDELVRCAYCQLHLPRAEARAAGGRFFCSEEHQRLGPGNG